MKTDDAIEYFGGISATAKAIGITRAAVWQWGETVPIASAMKIEIASKGKLKFEKSAYIGTAGKWRS